MPLVNLLISELKKPLIYVILISFLLNYAFFMPQIEEIKNNYVSRENLSLTLAPIAVQITSVQNDVKDIKDSIKKIMEYFVMAKK